MKQKYFPEYSPYDIFKSKTLAHLFYQMDDKMYNLEQSNIALFDEVEKWKKDYFELINQRHREGQDMMANVLKACISTPSLSSIGPVGATMLARIGDMNSIEEVKEYLKQVREENRDELKDIEDSVKEKTNV